MLHFLTLNVLSVGTWNMLSCLWFQHVAEQQCLSPFASNSACSAQLKVLVSFAQVHEVENAYGTVLAAICFCSFIYPIVTASVPVEAAA